MSPDKFDRSVRSYIMSRIRSKGTLCERRLRGALIQRGVNGFKMHLDVVGRPDFAFPREKIAVFCDSDFWHGRKPLPASNRSYWRAKMKRNAARDLTVNAKLKAQGWAVIRLSESEIMASSWRCVQIITKELKRRKGKRRPSFPAQTCSLVKRSRPKHSTRPCKAF